MLLFSQVSVKITKVFLNHLREMVRLILQIKLYFKPIEHYVEKEFTEKTNSR